MADLKKRIALYSKKKKISMQARHPFLLSLEGWYRISCRSLENIALMEEYTKSGSTLKYTRWLCRVKDFTPEQASVFGKQSVYDVKISCRYADFLRVGETKHYITCFRPEGSFSDGALINIHDPNMAIAFISDRSGKFQWRSFIRLVKDEDYALAFYLEYGNPQGFNIQKHLAEKLNVTAYSAFPKIESNIAPLYKKSPSKMNKVFKFMYCDHILSSDSNNYWWIGVRAEPLYKKNEYSEHRL